MDGLAGFVKYWGNSKGVERVMEARSRATHEVILVFEYVPNVASSWLVTHPTDLAKLNDNGAEIFEHLRNHGIAHLDSHLSNFLTDGTEFYLTDFELSLSPAFELSTQERSFLKEHRYYDQAELLAASCNVVHAFYQAATESQRAKVRERFEGIEQLSLRPRCSLLLEHLDEVRRLLALPRSLVSFAEKHQDLAYLFNDFLFRLASSNSKRAKLDHEAVDAALINAGLTQIFEAK